MSEQAPQREPEGDEEPAVPPRFIGYLASGGLLLAVVVFASGLPGLLGMPRVSVALPTPAAKVTPAVVPVPTATLRPVRVAIDSPGAGTQLVVTPTPTPATSRFVVGNTNGDGVSLRRSPKLDDRWLAWQDGTVMEVVGPEVSGDGLTWRHVRDPRGNTGYIPSQYLIPLTEGR